MNKPNTLKIKFRLSDLLDELMPIAAKHDRDIYGLASDSCLVEKDCLFFAYPGYEDDGRKYIDAAIANGASAILCEGDEIKTEVKISKTQPALPVPIFYFPCLAARVGEIAAKFYDFPTKKMQIIGVTGTNGKTSIVQFIHQALAALGKPCAMLGTLGIGRSINDLAPTQTTTPDAISLQKHFAEFLAQNIKTAALEASSHSLAQNRLQGIDFKIAIFTNLTRDHLDYHQNMENYGAAKKRLFLMPNLEYAIINADDAFGRKLLNELPVQVKPFAYGITGTLTSVPTLRTKNIQLSSNGFSAEVNTPWGEGTLQTSLLGRFNLSNLLAVLATLCLLGISLKDALASITKLTTVPGRMQTLGGGNKKPLMVIDYAHTPDALEKALLALREHCYGELWCVFGCGGDRDKGKRPIMGQIAERYSDQIIITNDNPRSEDPEKITNDILKGLLCPWAAQVEHDRKVAIYQAVASAKANDVILIAGKGHENYQLIGENKIPFSDLEKAQIALLQKRDK